MTLREQARQQADLLQQWMSELPDLPLPARPDRIAVVCVDLIEGFTREGPLASPRVAEIIPGVVDLIRRLLGAGVPAENVVLVQDSHPQDAREFAAYPPHCVAGTPEAEAVAELRALPEFPRFRHFQKNSIASHTSPEFQAWLAQADFDMVIALGDVTDLCLYTLALHLVTFGMANHKDWTVIVPEGCVQTWDAPGHPGDLYHALFLHQLERNGVQVVRNLAF
ncbi:cysteine hydrolase [Deinococcus metallilatus]|uniref:Cysteine hydrolase n=1 Tax=Deinococcus metallilatus TaxID=1211322 RepID=A0AAJ5JXC8_9DEIO|nr:cysteine hydrolase family protein [Deinococcus metallilatus]MBB5296115.1 nicotinamidase-related amidase [Deinococcus metallilatus]QBY09830.1 cysteine hydrolase [Deinococcus metallilatus]RXJ08827.1 cysteine hydrolase [Deinococcus metallilatus]TLK23307.1 cysteine hydrolase [Deinococcus metallilatus]GMA13981.1 nicotinamidase [Deinococcus metallilatus]